MSFFQSKEPKAIAQRAAREAVSITVFIIVLRLIFAVPLFIDPLPNTTRWPHFGSLLDCLLLAGLAYGVYRMSRVCAMLLFAYFVADQLIQYYFQVSQGGTVGSLILIVGAIFLS